MNALGLLISGRSHATGFAVIGSMAYLALRRWSPAAGVLAAAASLIIMAAGLDGRPAAPGLDWCDDYHRPDGTRRTAAGSISRLEVDQANRPRGGAESGISTGCVAANTPASPTSRNDAIRRQSAWIEPFLTELRQPAVALERSRWSWPEWVVLGFVRQCRPRAGAAGRLASGPFSDCGHGACRSTTAI